MDCNEDRATIFSSSSLFLCSVVRFTLRFARLERVGTGANDTINER
jgi:hypothetical protein